MSEVFKALGVVKPLGIDFIDDKSATLHLKNFSVELKSLPTLEGKLTFKALQKLVTKLAYFPRLLVYPKFKHYPERDALYAFQLDLKGYEKIKEDGQIPFLFSTIPESYFLVSGLYQKIPVCDSPVISVFKNRRELEIKPDFSSGMFRANHIPVQSKVPMKIKPFRFTKGGTEKAKFLCTALKLEEGKFWFSSAKNLVLKEEVPAYFKRKKLA